MGGIVVLFCSRLLFTDQIIRASDVITQFFWTAKQNKDQTLLQYIQGIPVLFRAAWDPLNDGGRTLEGGANAIGLLLHRYLILHFLPFPTSIAWLAVISLLWGGAGTYCYCRLIGVSRFSSFAAGLLFALCTENASLINAGHIQKIETISWFPWVLFFLERALRNGRLFNYALTALMLALQFFNMHWQISFYSCLAAGAYWVFHAGAEYVQDQKSYLRKGLGKDVLLALVMVILFFTTIGMSFVPLVSWSQQSERSGAVVSGGGGGGGMNREEGMSWSMPPEEILTFYVPGLVGYSRQEAGDVPKPGQVFYWGRMHFTQTNDYLGLLPWLIIPLLLAFRRDRYTWTFTFFMGMTLVMALGKYTFVYRFMYDHLPGFATFRVPKMILFIFAFAASVLMARGLDLLSEKGEERKRLRGWLIGLGGFACALILLALFLQLGPQTVLSWTEGFINQPTRYQNDPSLIGERYANMIRETWFAVGVLCVYLVLLVAWFFRRLPAKYLLAGLLALLLVDLWRVNDKFFVLCPPPAADRKQAKNDVIGFLEKNIGTYRMQALGRDSFYYSDYGLPNISAYVTVSERRYKEYLDSLSLQGGMSDIMSLKYLVMPGSEYESQKASLSEKFMPVFRSASTGDVVLENKTVLPKAWLVPSVAVVNEPQQRLAIMNSDPNFKPAAIALVESAPALPMAPYGPRPAMGSASLESYGPNRIVVKTKASENTLLVLSEKYYKSWRAEVDGKRAAILPTDHILRGVYVPAGEHTVVFSFYSVPFETGKYLTLASFVFFAILFGREWQVRRKQGVVSGERI
ncbi:hypothetical protein FO488_13780 [Geobacter sp. FeAm09]|nr:hypothetical protein FO488_13780 [Geobacter sp. FeAm09]